MTPLQRNALACKPMTEAEVESIYADCSNAGKRMCESHERLRVELQGAEAIIADYERRIKELEALVNMDHATLPATAELLQKCPKVI